MRQPSWNETRTAAGWVAALGVAAAALACGEAEVAVSAACRPYPKVLDVAPVCAQDVDGAWQALRSLNDAATGNWSATRCGFTSLDHLMIPLPDCFDQQPVQDAFAAALDAWPEIFQLRSTDVVLRTRPVGRSCGDIIANAAAATHPSHADTYASIERVAYGGVPFDGPAGVARFSVVDGVVYLRGVTHLDDLVVRDDLLAEVQACDAADPLPLTTLAERVRSAAYPYVVLENPIGWCEGELVEHRYTPGDRDTLQWQQPHWITASAATLQRIRRVRLFIAAANVPGNPGSLACSNSDFDPVYGFDISVDVVTGEIVHSLPGLGCIWC